MTKTAIVFVHTFVFFAGWNEWSDGRSERSTNRIRYGSKFFNFHRISKSRGVVQGPEEHAGIRGTERRQDGDPEETVHLHVTGQCETRFLRKYCVITTYMLILECGALMFMNCCVFRPAWACVGMVENNQKHSKISKKFSFNLNMQLLLLEQNVCEVNRERSRLATTSSVCYSTQHNGLVTLCYTHKLTLLLSGNYLCIFTSF